MRTFSFFAFTTLALCACTLSCIRKKSAADSGQQNSNALQPAGGNLIKNADFEDDTSLPWNSSFTPPAKGAASVKDGALCLTIENGGSNNWDAQIRHREMVPQKGHIYNISFKIWSDKPTQVRAKVGMSGAPYTEYFTQNMRVSPQPQLIKGGFIMRGADDPSAEFAFHAGGSMLRGVELPVVVCVDDIRMNDPDYIAPEKAENAALSSVRINQVGYFPHGKKIATVVSTASEAIEWELMQGDTPVAQGQTLPYGLDSDSGDDVHLIDFSQFDKIGSGYRIKVAGQVSPPFAIEPTVYSLIKYDALNYFYQNRSGIEITMPHARQAKWARPAGHAQSDKHVACAPDAECSYELDVSRGWYDAGDHGKYVVNGGIALWTLFNQYERFLHRGDIAPFADNTMDIPESGNGVPDLLDEARWEMDFMLSMQVPEGQKQAGLVHHKVHDIAWTGLGLAPHEAEKKMKRQLRPVSTAATLNLAATAAQAARIFESIDPGYSARCLAAAEKAFLAAREFPNLFAPASDSNKGGGAYDDQRVDDEFFWAAAELYITTKNPEYLQFAKSNQYWQQVTKVIDSVPSMLNWQSTDGLGAISLAIVPNQLGKNDLKLQRKKLMDAANEYLELIERQGYRMPFSSGTNAGYPWGSNSFIINNALVLALAHDLSKEDQYLEGALQAMDYILGRNAMAQSYVTGWGSRPLKNPHHRFWSHQVDARFPMAAPGALSGGPNSGLQDPYVAAAGLNGCAPQKCFMDNIEAWSVNEITVNWNAPFAWVTAYLDENGNQAKAE